MCRTRCVTLVPGMEIAVLSPSKLTKLSRYIWKLHFYNFYILLQIQLINYVLGQNSTSMVQMSSVGYEEKSK
jgi:hypothetical protein